MLLPILILQPDVQKILHKLSSLFNQKGWNKWQWNLIYVLNSQLRYLPVVATIPVKLHYLPGQGKRNLHKPFTDKSYYIFACHKHKNQQFFQQMNDAERQLLFEQLKLDYSDIIINYFTTDKTIKEKIDKFINAVFYANIPVPQIIQIHMELIDEFSKQLKLEGRSDEALLDYRLTLIDILAHLCEVYRGTISK